MDQIKVNTLTELSQRELQSVTGGFRLMYPGQGLGRMILQSILGTYQMGYDEAQNNCEC